MKIALIGAPGSGKTQLAGKLADKLGRNDTYVVDGYAQSIETNSELALGPMGNHLANLYVALERWEQERFGAMHTEHVISCGTLIETAVYTAMHFTSLLNIGTEESKLELTPRMDATLRMLAVLYNDAVDYDYAFYLPPVKANEDAAFIDQQLQAGLAGFKLVPVTPLTDPETQLADALKVLEVHAA